MTAPRLTRATRTRFFVGIAALILMVGFVAIFNSSQQQLDKSREMTIRCEQHQESLNAQLQAVIEQKFRLEKSLESERKEHDETKQKLKEERDIHGKSTHDSNVRFDSLQQAYKLEQSEHADLADECSKTKRELLEQINGLERKAKSFETLLAQTKSQHNKDVEHWTLKYKTLEGENERTKELLKASGDQIRNKLAKQIEDFKMNCAYRPPHFESTENSVLPQPNPLKSASLVKEFKEQIAIIPKSLNSGEKHLSDDSNKDTMQQPPPMNAPYKSSTSPTDLKTSENNKQAVPAASSTSEKTKRSSTQANNGRQRVKPKELPLGVAPVPDNFEDLIKNADKDNDDNNNNRYANVVDGLAAKNEDAEQENGAHEVKDNDFNLGDDKNDDGKDHLMEVLNNAAEEDTNNIDGKPSDLGHNVGDGVLVAPNQNLLDDMKKDNDDGNDDIDIVENNKNHLHHDDDNDKLKNEVDGDEGKEIIVRHDAHEEQNQEDGDDDEYPNNARQQEGEAVRN